MISSDSPDFSPAATAVTFAARYTLLIGGMPALNNASQCLCCWGGVITFMLPGQFTTMVP
jgi:hypothetical protein